MRSLKRLHDLQVIFEIHAGSLTLRCIPPGNLKGNPHKEISDTGGVFIDITAN